MFSYWSWPARSQTQEVVLILFVTIQASPPRMSKSRDQSGGILIWTFSLGITAPNIHSPVSWTGRDHWNKAFGFLPSNRATVVALLGQFWLFLKTLQEAKPGRHSLSLCNDFVITQFLILSLSLLKTHFLSCTEFLLIQQASKWRCHCLIEYKVLFHFSLWSVLLLWYYTCTSTFIN